MRLLAHPEILWRADGTPEAEAFHDIYFTPGDGLAESRAVFFAGCGLPEAWRGRKNFTIAETGFGTGLNFLGLWQLWCAHRPSPDAVLHFVSFEAFPLKRRDAERALSVYAELAPFAEKLLHVWPEPVKGTRQHVWPEAGVTLTLHLGEIAQTLPRAIFKADAWFLDGFSPARNPDMWSRDLFRLMAQKSAPGARAATFTVAGQVRGGLEAAGFAVAKQSGHGRKRERLEAMFPGTPKPQTPPPRVAIVGAGIAGACAARALCDLGASVTVFDPAKKIASGASGNPLALIMPRLDAGETVEARLLIDAYLATLDFYHGLPGITETDVSHRARTETEIRRFDKLMDDPPLTRAHLDFTPRGLVHHRALIASPHELISALLNDVAVRLGQNIGIGKNSRTVNGEVFDVIILAQGAGLGEALPFMTLEPRLGQVDFCDVENDRPVSALAAGHYALGHARTRLWGATFEALTTPEPDISAAARASNRAALEALNPDWITDLENANIQSRASVRATTPDRLPLIGALPVWPQNAPHTEEIVAGVFVAGGYGSRGFTFAPWAARLLAAEIMGAPMPAASDLIDAANPMRFVKRALKKR